MSESQPTKRARANTAGEALKPNTAPQGSESQATEQGHQKPTDREMKLLTSPIIKELLEKAAEMHPDVNNLVMDAIRRVQEQHRQRVINFDHYSSSIWKQINVTYRSMRGSKQYDMAWEVVGDVVATITTISGQCDEFSSPQTRENGLSVLRKIGKTICLSSNDTLGHEVQKQFQSDPSLERGMYDIVSAMSVEERQSIVNSPNKSDGLWAKLKELQELSEGYCVFEGLWKVMALLSGAENHEGFDDDDDDDEDDDEDDDDDDDDEGEFDEDDPENYDEKDMHVQTGDEHDIY
ncbi:uncharacterized protein N7483_005417 [Penicillium malachiteum]|uniref:uncharacterized protein n=1 Tax=Penicillium malachiteum TaxID=1324776 RepID=UPI0025470562|nr:uncharacterized protein N7483_005417 [Penicillium malachiteum]KAJ5730909.1 hypothetical protein N7483_005417 [Penicillium malachiteum]